MIGREGSLLHCQAQQVRRASHGHVVHLQAVPLLIPVGGLPAYPIPSDPRSQLIEIMPIPEGLTHQCRRVALALNRVDGTYADVDLWIVIGISEDVIPSLWTNVKNRLIVRPILPRQELVHFCAG